MEMRNLQKVYKKKSQHNIRALSFFGHICDALHDLVPFVQFKKREKHPWWSVNFSKVAGSNSLKEKLIGNQFCMNCRDSFRECTTLDQISISISEGISGKYQWKLLYQHKTLFNLTSYHLNTSISRIMTVLSEQLHVFKKNFCLPLCILF